jgi:3-methyladenine DNA glycosylase AlkD
VSRSSKGPPLADIEGVLETLRTMGDPSNVAGMERFGIDSRDALGIRVTDLRTLARKLGRDHDLAAGLWRSGLHEARMLASMVDEPERVTRKQMESWIAQVRSWDLCDGLCGNLFDRTPFWLDTALEWSTRDPEFTKRGGFALMAWSAVHRKAEPDERFEVFLSAAFEQATDPRNYVKKAVSWALRQVGKRSAALHASALSTARQLLEVDDPTARWIARDALRELESRSVLARLGVGRP